MIECSAITTGKIADGAIVNADINNCAAVATSKFASGLITQDTLVPLDQNLSLLGFKMAVNEGLTVFNLVDGIVDEFHDESGADEGEGSNDTYTAACDYYSNQTPAAVSAGFTTTSITEPTTSATATNPAYGSGTDGTFTVPTGMTSVNIQAWGAGAGSAASNHGGGGGYAEGTLAVTEGQVLYNVIGEGSTYAADPAPVAWGHFDTTAANAGGSEGSSAATPGAGLAGVFTSEVTASSDASPLLPAAVVIAGGGGGAGFNGEAPNGGGGGGLVGFVASPGSPESGGSAAVGSNGCSGGGGDQEQGGQGGNPGGNPGVALSGGAGEGVSPLSNGAGGGGAGYYGGGGGEGNGGAGGGGSSYYGHPQVTSGATEAANDDDGVGGGVTQPNYVPGTNEGGAGTNQEDGYILLTGNQLSSATSNIVSNAFTASSAPSTARIVVFQENVDSITLNTDLIASISRDGGTTFTTATLSDSGYVTGSSGQRILTGSATISGQPSGTSMRWKLALANNASKIHGVSLQWK